MKYDIRFIVDSGSIGALIYSLNNSHTKYGYYLGGYDFEGQTLDPVEYSDIKGNAR